MDAARDASQFYERNALGDRAMIDVGVGRDDDGQVAVLERRIQRPARQPEGGQPRDVARFIE